MKSHRPATHNRKKPVYRDKADMAWSGTMKKFRELREDWRIGKLEKDIFQGEATSAAVKDGVSIETSEEQDASMWTNRQAEYHKKRKEMLDYDSFEEFVSAVSSRHDVP